MKVHDTTNILQPTSSSNPSLFTDLQERFSTHIAFPMADKKIVVVFGATGAQVHLESPDLHTKILMIIIPGRICRQLNP